MNETALEGAARAETSEMPVVKSGDGADSHVVGVEADKRAAPRFASCRACGTEFKKDGATAQSADAPRLCVDCYHRERAWHPHHSPGVACLMELVLA